MKRILYYHLIVSTVFLLAAAFTQSITEVISVAMGCGLIGANLGALVWSWQRIFLKKSIALAVSVIVIKYAILGVIIYLVMVSDRVDQMAFIIGITSLIPSVVIFALNFEGPTPDKKNRRSLDMESGVDGTF